MAAKHFKTLRIHVYQSLLKWLRGFLTTRLQRVVINGCFLNGCQFSLECPWVLFLGPFCFSFTLMIYLKHAFSLF